MNLVKMELLQLDHGKYVEKGTDGAILAVGPMVYNALEVAKNLMLLD
ncbi:MAG: hypothetical protein CM15mP106_6750 [Candidatus Neomarinimicrobiota bacterium]|nr:MAG: hypothetical protein CM15mP106_6750 [Candidatus Neomarinimicrobiota bacterium]